MPTTTYFVENIKSDNLLNMVCDVEEHLREINNHDWECSFGSQDDIASTLQDIMDRIDFFSENIITDYGFYWCGILSYDPWSVIQGKYDGEEGILNLIKEHHLLVVNRESDGVFIEFVPNAQSPLYKFLLKHSNDGWEGNIESDINAVIRRIIKIMKKELGENTERYGTWYQSMYCPSCECWTFSDDKCPECGGELYDHYIDNDEKA